MDSIFKKSNSLAFDEGKMDPFAKSNSSSKFDPKEIDPIPKKTSTSIFDKEGMDPIAKNSSSFRFDRNRMDPIPKKTSSLFFDKEKMDPIGKYTSSSRSDSKRVDSNPQNTSTLIFDQKKIDPILNKAQETTPISKEGQRTILNSETTTATTSTSTSEAKTSDSCASIERGSSGSAHGEGLETGSIAGVGFGSGGGAPFKPHTGGDERWEAIQVAKSREAPLTLSHFRLLKRLGYGDIGSVYLAELRGTSVFFAMKVMDKASLVSRNKLIRAQTERDILGLLDHPFLPTLYSHFETDKFYCLVMEFCCGGNLHSLRQKQPNKYFSEEAARFFASEVLLALEYLHMLGIVYRDLKPENVLVREEGHIMLSDFDLSLQCSVSPTLVKSSSLYASSGPPPSILDADYAPPGCIQPSAFFPRILPKKTRKSKSDFGLFAGGALPELMAEPTNARSMSFVGTHEYLAPEIVRGEGHGSAVDWWTFGIFLYELLHGTTPFKGSGNRATLFNVVGQPLRFPDAPIVSLTARDLIRGLLVKDPQRRIAYRRGATEIKQHPFFEGVNWALVRSTMPPHIPEPLDLGQFASKEVSQMEKMVGGGGGGTKSSAPDSSYLDFDYF